MIHKIIALIIGIGFVPLVYGQDTIYMETMVQRAIQYYPTVLKANEAISQADARAESSKAVWRPQISLNGGYTWITPQPKIPMNDRDLPMEPMNQGSFNLKLSQLLWGFGQNKSKVATARLEAYIAMIQKSETLQQVALEAVQNYHSLWLSRRSIAIKQQLHAIYETTLKQAKINQETGAGTAFDVLNTRVSYVGTESDLESLYADNKTIQERIKLLCDTAINNNMAMYVPEQLPLLEDSIQNMTLFAILNRPELIVARNEIEVASLQELGIKRDMNPSIRFNAEGGMKNGYFPNLDLMKFNTALGVTVEIPIYSGGAHKQNRKIAESRIRDAEASLKIMEIEVKKQLTSQYNSLVAGYKRYATLQLKVEAATEALRLAHANYSVGQITNLELLTSINNMGLACLQLEQQRVDMLDMYYSLLVTVGQPIYNTSLVNN
ncbi:MAG: TolC family protein [Marinifilaceae bacterium]